jgi:hypothetical protein
MDKSLSVVKRIPKFDCSSGAGRLSVPQQHLASVLNDAGRGERDRTGLELLGPLLRVHQVGKKAVGQLPNAALLGALVLVSNELIKREYTSKSATLPPYIRDLANSTLAELDTKLKTLSELEWYDRAKETGTQLQRQSAQAQPLELVDYMDQYLVRDLLPRIDKELSPFLSTLITDPAEVQKITARWEQLHPMHFRIRHCVTTCTTGTHLTPHQPTRASNTPLVLHRTTWHQREEFGPTGNAGASSVW